MDPSLDIATSFFGPRAQGSANPNPPRTVGSLELNIGWMQHQHRPTTLFPRLKAPSSVQTVRGWPWFQFLRKWVPFPTALRQTKTIGCVALFLWPQPRADPQPPGAGEWTLAAKTPAINSWDVFLGSHLCPVGFLHFVSTPTGFHCDSPGLELSGGIWARTTRKMRSRCAEVPKSWGGALWMEPFAPLGSWPLTALFSEGVRWHRGRFRLQHGEGSGSHRAKPP